MIPGISIYTGHDGFIKLYQHTWNVYSTATAGMMLSAVRGLLHSSDMVSAGQCCPGCSAQEITKDYLSRLQAAEPEVQSFISVASESACAAARALDGRIASDGADSLGPLAAVPLGIKVCSSGLPTVDHHGLTWCLNIPICSGLGTTR